MSITKVTKTLIIISAVTSYTIWIDMVNIIAYTIVFHTNPPRGTSFILISNIDSKDTTDHDSVSENGAPMNIIISIILLVLIFCSSLYFYI